MRISDWSSDVCSSDLFPLFAKPNASLRSLGVFMIEGYGNGMLRLDGGREATVEEVLDRMIGDTCYLLQAVVRNHAQIRSYASALAPVRSAARRVGKECVRTFRSRWSTCPENKNKRKQ